MLLRRNKLQPYTYTDIYPSKNQINLKIPAELVFELLRNILYIFYLDSLSLSNDNHIKSSIGQGSFHSAKEGSLGIETKMNKSSQ